MLSPSQVIYFVRIVIPDVGKVIDIIHRYMRLCKGDRHVCCDSSPFHFRK